MFLKKGSANSTQLYFNLRESLKVQEVVKMVKWCQVLKFDKGMQTSTQQPYHFEFVVAQFLTYWQKPHGGGGAFFWDTCKLCIYSISRGLINNVMPT